MASGGADLIEDIHRQQRRRVLKRAAQLTALAVALLLVGLGFKIVADRSARTRTLDTSREQFLGGTIADMRSAMEILERSLASGEEHPDLEANLALVRAHLWAEFGLGEAEARAAVDDTDPSSAAGRLARAILAFTDGDLEAAEAALSEVPAEPEDWMVQGERAWLVASIAAARHPAPAETMQEALAALGAHLAREPNSIPHRRLEALLLLLSNDSDGALEKLERARDLSRTHVGLAADEALYNAYLHQELAGVASVADQLLEGSGDRLSPRDRAHVVLARAVVHVRSGESQEGLGRLDEAWEGLGPWNRMARELAIQTALEAGDTTRAPHWLPDSGLPDTDQQVYLAWATLLQGRVMQALEQLAALPQEHPWVGFLQALALVEQRRWEEARPWLDRTERLLPGRPDVEVARARVELHLGDPEVALRKLRALAEEEPYAPRAWTGLGEACLAQAEPDLKAAKRALERAIEREPIPAEAMLQLATLWDRRRKTDAEAERKALDLMQRAAEANPHLPRYREELGLYLSELGYDARAMVVLREVSEGEGITWRPPLTLARLKILSGTTDDEVDTLLDRAEKLGAPRRELVRERARLGLARGTKESLAQAQTALAGLLEEDPADVESRVLYATTYLEQFDRKTAEQVVRRGFAATPDDRHGRLWLAWARIEARAGKYKNAAPRARSAWNRMLEENRPARELLEAADLASRAWIRQKKDRVALGIVEQLTSRLAFHSDAWTIRARTELAAGEAAAARESADRAIELDERNPRAHEIRGHALLRFGYRDKAKEAYQTALDLAKGTPLEDGYRSNLRNL